MSKPDATLQRDPFQGLSERLEAIRALPEAGMLSPLDPKRTDRAARMVFAILRATRDRSAVGMLTGLVDLLSSGSKGRIAPDVVRLGVFAVAREILSNKTLPEQVLQVVVIAWNAVCLSDLRIRIGRGRNATPHKGDLRDAFYDLDVGGRHARPRSADDSVDFSTSRLARVVGYSVSSTAAPA